MSTCAKTGTGTRRGGGHSHMSGGHTETYVGPGVCTAGAPFAGDEGAVDVGDRNESSVHTDADTCLPFTRRGAGGSISPLPFPLSASELRPLPTPAVFPVALVRFACWTGTCGSGLRPRRRRAPDSGVAAGPRRPPAAVRGRGGVIAAGPLRCGNLALAGRPRALGRRRPLLLPPGVGRGASRNSRTSTAASGSSSVRAETVWLP